MVSSLSSSNNYYYKHPISTVPFLGFPSQHDQIARPNNDNHNFKMWLDQDDSFSSLFCTNFGDIDDLVVPEFTNFDSHLAYPIISEGGNCDFLPALSDGRDVYGNISPVEYGECSGESSCYGVGSYQVYENRDDNIASNMFKTYLLSNNHAISTTESSGIQLGEKRNEVKVGKYSVEERKGRILRYLKKRNQRNFNKTIKYACRKSLADRRVRIHGRFAKNQEEDDQPQTNETVQPHDYNLGTPYTNIDKNEEYYEDEWLLQAMAWPNCFLIN